MASEIRVDTSKNTSGLCTVTYSNTGAVLSGITTGTFSGSGASLTTLNGSNISSGTVATARLGSGTASSSTFLRGDGSWASNTSTTINSNADNRIITGSGTANTLNGESNFTYDGDEVAIYAQTDDTDCILHLVGKTASGGVGQAGRTAIIAESTHNSNGRSSMHLRTRNTSNAQIIGMTIDGDQNVGIGTQLPDNRLEIYKGSAGTYLKAGGDNANNGRSLTFTSSATSNSVDGGKHTINASSGHGELALATAGSERMIITSSGAVAIGTDAPTYSSGDIQHEIKKNNNRTYTAPLMTAHSHLLLNNSDTTTGAFCGIGMRAGTGDGSFGYVFTGSANAADFVINTDGGSNGIERLRILNAGSVGIGTDNPGYKLHVSQTSSAVARFERTGGAWAKVDIKAGSSSGNSYLTFSDSDASEVGAINYEHGDNSLRFETYDGSSKQLRAVLDTSGNFYVADQPSFSIRTANANSFGTSSAHYALSYSSPLPIFTSGQTVTEHHVGSWVTYHDYVAGSNTGRYVKFTAPVAGNYLFGYNAECVVAADDWAGFGFEINNTGTHNTTLERLVAWTHNQSAEDSTAQSRRRSFQASCLIRLAASDYVVPYQQSSSTSTMQNTFRVWGMLVN